MVRPGLQRVPVDQSHAGQRIPDHNHNDCSDNDNDQNDNDDVNNDNPLPVHRPALPGDDEGLVAGGQAADGVIGLLEAPLSGDAALLDTGTSALGRGNIYRNN